jgi:2-octaprenyl-6-methoxyphenol hydroxylase
MTRGPEPFDAAVVGLGPAGLAAALALAHSGLDVALVGTPPAPEALARETRTTALFGGNIEMLRHLGVWPALLAEAAPLTGLRLVDDTGGLLRAPEILFGAAEAGRDALGYNIDNARLIAALLAAAGAAQRLRPLPVALAGVRAEADGARLALADGGTIAARLVVGADGRQSLCRAAAGVATERWSYPQAALATRFTHTRPHHGISSELHRRHGPLTTVPLPGPASSLVWVERVAEIERLSGLPEPAFRAELETRLMGLLGSVASIGPRATFPLAGLTARPVAGNRIVLVGEAGHVIPPIGAQGLNLGFRDAAWIAELAGQARADGRDVGGPEVIAAYVAARAGDVATRTLAVDLLNRSLYAGLLPADLARGAAVAALHAVPWLRGLVMREGLDPSGPRPRLLQPAEG